MVKVLDKGSLDLIDSYGDDLRIVNSARISFRQESFSITPKETGLINFLMKNKHATPFESVDFTFKIKCPITVAREWFRHRMASYNEKSGRYTKLEYEFYVPGVSAIRSQVGKPGDYHFESLGEPVAQTAIATMLAVYAESYKAYERLLSLGVAKELARSVLAQGLYTEFIFKANLRSILNFISLRSAESAMYEIRVYAQAMEPMVRSVVPIAWEAFEKNGREAI